MTNMASRRVMVLRLSSSFDEDACADFPADTYGRAQLDPAAPTAGVVVVAGLNAPPDEELAVLGFCGGAVVALAFIHAYFAVLNPAA